MVEWTIAMEIILEKGRIKVGKNEDEYFQFFFVK